MKKCVEICCKTGKQYSVQTFDQQLYAIAQQIKWSRPLEFQNHIIRLGSRSARPPSPQSLPIDVIKHDKVWNTPKRMIWFWNSRGLDHFICWTTERLTDIPDLFWDALLRYHETFTGDMSSWNEDIAVLNSVFEAHLAPLTKDFREWGCAVSPTALKCPTICRVMFHLISADFFLVRPTIPPLLLLSLMMVFSVLMFLRASKRQRKCKNRS
jgi:hypothetical protein